MKIALGLGSFAALVIVIWAGLADGPTSSKATSSTGEGKTPAAEESAQSVTDEANEVSVADEDAKTVLEIEDGTVKTEAEDTPSEEGAQIGVTVDALHGDLGENLSRAPNKVQKALENVLGGAGIQSGSSPSENASEDNVANLEHDAISNEAWASLEQALTVEGFDSLAIGQVLLGAELDAETKDAVRSLLTAGEENTDQLQVIIPQLRKLLGL